MKTVRFRHMEGLVTEGDSYMRRHLLMHSLLTASLAIPCVWGAGAMAQSQGYYPEAALTDIYTKEQIEKKKAEDKEAQLAEQKDTYEREARNRIANRRTPLSN